MNHVTRIWERVYLGSIDDAESLAKLNPLKITTVLSVCPEPLRAKSSAIKYVQLPLNDGRSISPAVVEALMSAVWGGVRRGRLLVHCVMGISRSPVVAAAWVHRVGCKSIDAALSDVARLRSIEPSPVLLNSVREALQ